MKLYRHLAWDGIRKNSRLYVPYLLTGVGAVSFFYILVALSRLPEGTLPGSGSVQVILNLGSFVLWVFSLLLLFYTHSFLIRRRNREFALYNVLGITDTFFIYVLGNIGGGAYNIFLFKQFFSAMPKELEEAAAIDGCGFFQCFIRIIIPNAGAVILTTVLLSIMWYWNDYYMSSMYMNNMHTVTTALVTSTATCTRPRS